MDNLRRFILVFTAIIFIALSVCGIVLASSYSKSAVTEEKNLTVAAPTFDPQANVDPSTTLKENILFLIGDKDAGETELLLLVNIDSAKPAMQVLYIPKDLKYGQNADRSVNNMGRLLAKSGSAAAAAELVSSFFEISVNYYVQMPGNVFAEFVDAFDRDASGISYQIPVDLKYTSGKYHIDLKKDTQKLRGSEALQLIQFYKTENEEYTPELLAYYDGSDLKRIQTAQSFLKAFLAQKMLKRDGGDAAAYQSSFVQAMTPFLQKCDTNLTESHLNLIGASCAGLDSGAIKYYRFNGTEQYLGKFYLIYNNTCTDLNTNAVQDSTVVLRDSFAAN